MIFYNTTQSHMYVIGYGTVELTHLGSTFATTIFKQCVFFIILNEMLYQAIDIVIPRWYTVVLHGELRLQVWMLFYLCSRRKIQFLHAKFGDMIITINGFCHCHSSVLNGCTQIYLSLKFLKIHSGALYLRCHSLSHIHLFYLWLPPSLFIIYYSSLLKPETLC